MSKEQRILPTLQLFALSTYDYSQNSRKRELVGIILRISQAVKASHFDCDIRWFDSSIRNHRLLIHSKPPELLAVFIHFSRKRIYLRPEMRIQSVGFKTQRAILCRFSLSNDAKQGLWPQYPLMQVRTLQSATWFLSSTVEHPAHNRAVDGSTPSGITTGLSMTGFSFTFSKVCRRLIAVKVLAFPLTVS